MPGRDLTAIAAELRSEGLAADLPCVIVSRAGQPEQQIVQTTLAQLGRIPAVPAPAILLAGEALRDRQPGELHEIAGYALAAARHKPDSLEF